MKKLLMPLLGACVLCLAAASIVHTQPVVQRNDPPSPPPRSSFTSRVAAVGLVEASSENVSVGSHLPGVVEQVFVSVGQTVKKGDSLVKLDTRRLQAALTEAQALIAVRKASLETAKADVRSSEASLADVQRLLKIAEATDPRSISVEEVTRRRSAVEIAQARLGAARSGIDAAEAGIRAAEAGLNTTQVEIERSTVHAPIDGLVLQVKVRAGEFVPAGPTSEAWLLLGNVSPLHLRADIDEHEAWRVSAEAKAEAQVRGNSKLVTPLEFVRFEPFVLPKRSLTGEAVERVDTRVLQVIYRIANKDLRLFVGQQMDVFIETEPSEHAGSGAAGR